MAFVGRLYGKLLLDGVVGAGHLSRVFYKLVLTIPIHPSDLMLIDPEIYLSLNSILTQDIGEEDILGMTFTASKIISRKDKLRLDLGEDEKEEEEEEEKKNTPSRTSLEIDYEEIDLIENGSEIAV